MNNKRPITDSTTDGLPVAPSMQYAINSSHLGKRSGAFGKRTVIISAISLFLGIAGGLIAQGLTRLIGLITNISFYGKFSTTFSSPANNHLGIYVIFIPIIGAVIVGLMARYGSKGIRGHGIPEAMEQILLNESKIPPRLTFLKPISAAISIGTGGPFGAEGPIIATGGALGSLVGQLIKTTADERKTLLAAGAAAGMAATFGSPISAVLLAVELLLFEFRPQSLIPVALASGCAAAVRIIFMGSAPIFSIPNLQAASGAALFFYLVLGALVGFASVYVTRAVYFIEDHFEKLHVHWMWWTAIGAVAVGVIGFFSPHTMGVGYDNIDNILSGNITGEILISLFILKFLSWSISLGSGTSGGTLAPLFTIGGGLGSVIGAAAILILPKAGIDIRVAALVGMAAMFAGSARALLASVIFAFETTLQPFGLLPLLGGCTTAYLISGLLMKHTIMTEKIARRGIAVPDQYLADFLEQIFVKDCFSKDVIKIGADDTIEKVRKWFNDGSKESKHHNYPVVEEEDKLLGMISRYEILDPMNANKKTIREIIYQPLVTTYENSTIRETADLMAVEHLTILPVVDIKNNSRIVGIIAQSDVLKARRQRIEKIADAKKSISFSELLSLKNSKENTLSDE